MAFTYDESNIQGNSLNYARFLLGDVTDESHILEDSEINALVAMHGFNEGVAQLAESCVSRVSQQPDQYKDEAGIDVAWTKQRVAHWNELAKRLRGGIPTTVTPTGPEVAAAPITGPDLTKLGI